MNVDDEKTAEETEETGETEETLPQEVLLSRIESLIFVYPEPITVRRLARVLSLTGKRVRELIDILKIHYEDRGILLREISGGFQFHTNPQNADVIRSAMKVKPMRISWPALETLAIVAYRQPVTRAEVEEIRRVDSGGTLRFLFEKALVRILGRKEEPGRPIIYGTSAAFLELFNLKSLTDLPSLHEFTELWEEHQEIIDDDFGADEEAGENPEENSEENPEESHEENPVSETRKEPDEQ